MIDMNDLEQIKEHLEKVMLAENVREWMVIVNKGLLGNRRVVYSTDDRSKVKEKFEWYRDTYPNIKFRIMTKSSFRDSYHRFPEYIDDVKKQQLFGDRERKVSYGQSEVKKRYVFSPRTKDVEVDVEEPVEKEIIRTTVIKEPQQQNGYVKTNPVDIKKV